MRIRYFAGAADAAGLEESQAPGPLTLGELRKRLSAEHGPEFARVMTRCSFMVGGRRAAQDELLVQDDQTVDVLPPFAGG